MDPDRKVKVRGRSQLAVVGAALTVLGGVAACASWLAGVPELTRLMAGSSLIQFNTGLLFALAGATLVAELRSRSALAAAGAAIVVLLAGATLAQYLWGRDFGIDQLVVPGNPHGGMPGRMAPNTAVTFLLAGFALLVLTSSRRLPWTTGVVQMLGALVLALGGIAVVGYALDLPAAFQWAGLTRMALYTAIGFVVLGAALMQAAVQASPEGAWHEMPWLAATTGVGLAALSALGWYALRRAPTVEQQHVSDLVLAFGLLVAALLTGVVAQGRHLRRQAGQLGLANAALQASEAQLQLLLDNVQTAVVVHGADSAIRYANPAAATILGLTRDQLLGRTTIDPAWHFVRENGEPMPVTEYPVSLVLARKAALHDYIVGVRAAPGRNARWVLVNAVPDLAPDGKVRLIIVSFVDFSERQHQTLRFERMALTDALTGLASRRHFLAEAERELSRARRGHALSLLMIDVDHFKSINDTHGHAAGDRVLVELGRTLHAVLREADLAGRLGGEEFGVLLPDADATLALAVAERARSALAAAKVPLDPGGTLGFTSSVGVATLEPGDGDAATLIARADAALYAAKRAGRNCVQVAASRVAA
jgi:diguanylate cyclase (GGDEF)-like protein/PAS domain S-box-containing protein